MRRRNNMSELKNIKQIIVEIIISVLPMTITSIVHLLCGEKISLGINIGLIIVSYLISAIAIFLFNKHIGKSKRFRTYKKYEGKWIEIIPGFSREISVCTLHFEHDGYHFDGVNYNGRREEPVNFKSKKFITNKKNDFYYITKNDYSVDRFEGFGKVYALSDSDRGFYIGKGYFFDVSSREEQKIHNTIMIKFDERFYDHNLEIKCGEDPSKFTDREIYEHIIDYVKRNYNLEAKV